VYDEIYVFKQEIKITIEFYFYIPCILAKRKTMKKKRKKIILVVKEDKIFT
jgi:hypothetical protein